MKFYFQINQGYETLRREAPRFWESMGMPSNMGAGMPGMDNNMRQMMQQMGYVFRVQFDNFLSSEFSGLGAGTGGGLGGAQNVTPAPDAETRFASQLEQLEMMGFTNKTGIDFSLAEHISG